MRVVAEFARISADGGYRFAMQTNRHSGEFRYDSAAAMRLRLPSEVSEDA